MKTFKDLEHKTHTAGMGGTQATMNFQNDYGVSVIRFKGSYGYPKKYELAVLYKDELTYNTPITNDVIGHLSEVEVSDIMKKVQNL